MRIHIHANCQALPLAGLLNEAYPEWHTTFFEVHAQPIIDELDVYYHCVRTADVVLTQPIHDGFRERDDMSIGWIKANMRSDASLIVVPSLHFGAHHAGWLDTPSPGFDLLAAHLEATGFRTADALQHLLSPDLLSDTDIEREIALAITETRRREVDDQIDIKISPYLEEHARVRMLFHICNHPTRETAVFVANAVLDRMGFCRRVPVEGYDYQAYPHMPPLPSITRFLASNSGLTLDPEIYEMVRLHTVPGVALNLYYGQMIEKLSAIPPEELYRLIECRWPSIELMRRLAENNSVIPGLERWRL